MRKTVLALALLVVSPGLGAALPANAQEAPGGRKARACRSRAT